MNMLWIFVLTGFPAPFKIGKAFGPTVGGDAVVADGQEEAAAQIRRNLYRNGFRRADGSDHSVATAVACHRFACKKTAQRNSFT